jgi:hypothetical protein
MKKKTIFRLKRGSQTQNMFSFKLSRPDERYIPAHAYLVKEAFDPDNVEEGHAREEMDTNPEEDVPFQQFAFASSRCFECFTGDAKGPLYFRRDLIPSTLLPLNPGQLKGLESIDAITADQKYTLSVYMASPMPVHVSPVVVMLIDNVPPRAHPPHKDRYISWWQSAYQLRSMAFLAYTAAVPYHSSVSNTYPRECYDDEFLPQIQAYEEMHRARVDELVSSFPPPPEAGAGTQSLLAGETFASPAPQAPGMQDLQRFISYTEDFSLYYLHSLERYLFKVLIEPHLAADSPLTLDHFLTPIEPRVHLRQCENTQRAQKCVVDFFAFHVAATHAHEKRHAGDDYVQRNPFNLDDIGRRIVNAPPHELHNGYLDQRTAQEYWMFCDPR